MRKNNGFTLLEVLVVIGVIAVVSAVVAPSFLTWRSNSKLRGAAEHFRGDLQLAKSRAVRDAKTVIVKLKSDKYRIFVDAGNGSGGPPNGKYDPHEPVICERQLPAGIRLKHKAATHTAQPIAVAGGLFGAPTGAGEASGGVVAPPGKGSHGNKDDDDDDDLDDDDRDTESDSSRGDLQPVGNRNEISFDGIGRCLNPQNIVLENSKGKKRLVAINTLGTVKVIKID